MVQHLVQSDSQALRYPVGGAFQERFGEGGACQFEDHSGLYRLEFCAGRFG